MSFKQRTIFIGALCILISSAWLYFQGHKDNNFIAGTFSFIIIIGWGILMFVFAGKWIMDEREIKFNADKQKWLKQKVRNTTIYIIFAITVVSNFILIGKMVDKRIYNILTTQDTQITFSKVTKIENRHSRGGWKSYAIITYQADSRTIKQAIYNYNNKYIVGQILKIKYSVNYPEMFAVISIN